MRKVRAGNQREALIDAAETVVLRHGAGTLTLDAVAAEAAVSKGGLLYHFPSKDALIQAMITRLVKTFEGMVEKELAGEPEVPGRFMRAFLRATLDRPSESAEEEWRMSAALLAAVGNQPKLLEPLKQGYRRWLEAAEKDGLPPGRALAVFAALDGLWFWALAEVNRPSADQLRGIRGVLEALIAPAAAGRY